MPFCSCLVRCYRAKIDVIYQRGCVNRMRKDSSDDDSHSQGRVVLLFDVLSLTFGLVWTTLVRAAFIALTLLVEHQEGHLACKNRVMRCCHGYMAGVRCK